MDKKPLIYEPEYEFMQIEQIEEEVNTTSCVIEIDNSVDADSEIEFSTGYNSALNNAEEKDLENTDIPALWVNRNKIETD